MARIFISYSRVDREFVVALAKLLREVYGYENVWYDENLHGGDIWWKEILDAIAECDIFIYLLSNESVTSPYCLAEFQEAQRLYKGIVTVQVRDRTNISGKLSDIHYIDMKKGVNDTFAYNQLIRAIAKQEKLLKPRRPSRRKRTPHPRIDITEPDQAPQRGEIITPDLVVMETDTVIPHQKGKYRTRIVILVGLIAGLFALVFWFNRDANMGRDLLSQPLTMTLTASPTLSDENAVETSMAELLLMTDQANETAMAIVRQTESANNTLVASSWTPTSTSFIKLTASARLIETQVAQTAIALSHTPTPTSTFTPEPTMTPTLPPLQSALIPVSRNADWNPFEQDFDGVPMVLVPAGCFMMGSTGNSNEQPIHQQCFDSPFWMDKYEVRQVDFNRLGGVKAHQSSYVGDNLPIDNIMWNEARDFCQLRGGSLPTEAQWEYGARGVDNLMFPWGNDFMGNSVVYKNNSGSRPAEVGTRPDGVSWVGALDMSGNVWEWVISEYRPYPYDSADGRDNHDILGGRVLRGGSWNNTLTNLRLTKRFWNYATNWDNSFGFRCVREYE